MPLFVRYLLIGVLSAGLFVAAETARGDSGAETLAEAESPDARVRVSLTVSPKEPRLSDTILLTLRIKADATLHVEMPTFGTALGDLKILDISKKTFEVAPETETTDLVLKTVPTRGGTTPIWPIVVRYSDRREGLRQQVHSVELPACRLDILSDVTPETASLDNIPSSKEIVDIPSGISAWLVVGGILLAAVVLFLLLRSVRSRPDRDLISMLSAREIALKRLADLIEKRLPETDVKRFFIELTGIVRWYIEQRTAIRAPERTTEEFLSEIARQPGNAVLGSRELRERLQRFLESADMVKFAKFQPSHEDVLIGIRRAEEFIEALAEPEDADAV